MRTETKIKSLNDLLNLSEPMSISLLVEVRPDYSFDDISMTCPCIDRIDRALDSIEDSVVGFTTRVDNYLVIKNDVPGDGKDPTSSYRFFSPKVEWEDVSKAELIIVMRLDNKFEVIRTIEQSTVPPYTLLD